jgi:hypothetical protein
VPHRQFSPRSGGSSDCVLRVRPLPFGRGARAPRSADRRSA